MQPGVLELARRLPDQRTEVLQRPLAHKRRVDAPARLPECTAMDQGPASAARARRRHLHRSLDLALRCRLPTLAASGAPLPRRRCHSYVASLFPPIQSRDPVGQTGARFVPWRAVPPKAAVRDKTALCCVTNASLGSRENPTEKWRALKRLRSLKGWERASKKFAAWGDCIYQVGSKRRARYRNPHTLSLPPLCNKVDGLKTRTL